MWQGSQVVRGKSIWSRLHCVLESNKTGGSDALVGELLKYGGSGTIELLKQLFTLIWREELVSPQWRKGLIVNLRREIRRILGIIGASLC